MNKIRFALLSTLTAVAIGTLSFAQQRNNVVSVSAYTNGDAATYYNDILDTDTGSTLTNKLNTLNTAKRRRLINYYDLANYFPQTDPGYNSSTVTAFYSGTVAKFKGNMNREHIWPFSRLYNSAERGDTDIEKDLHMIRPAMSDDNEERGNKFYTLPAPDGQGWDPGSLGDVTYRGDSARIIFYSAIADLNLTVIDRDYDSSSNHTMGKLSTLLDWNLKYPVSAREKTRNEAAESIQGHRNPFIDHPEYACRIWGDYNQASRRACSAYGENGHLDIKQSDVAIEKFEMEMQDEVTFISSYKNANNPTYSWSLTDQFGNETTTDIASIVSTNNNTVKVRGLAVGVAYLTGRITSTLSSGAVENLFTVVKLDINPICDVSSIRIASFPHKFTYRIGEAFASSGISVIATFSDGREVDVTNDVTYSNTNFDTAGKRYVLVSYTYKGVTVSSSFPVFVEEDKKPTPQKSSGCGGNVITSSVLLSSLSLISAFLITVSVKKRKRK